MANFRKTWLIVAGFALSGAALSGATGLFLLKRSDLLVNVNRPASLSDIRFPAVLIHDGTTWKVVEGAGELETMPSQWYLNRRDDPVLIDSNFAQFILADLRMRGSELGLLISGPRPIQVSFRLTRDTAQSPQATRAQLIECLTRYGDPALLSAEREQWVRHSSLRELLSALRPADQP